MSRVRLPAIEKAAHAEDLLRHALREIAAFSRRHDTGPFLQCFEDSLRILDSGRREDTYHNDLAPPGLLTPEAEATLSACQKSWVFGGMGSWNDMGRFDGQEQDEYERVSEGLFQALNAALVAIVNTSLR